MRKQLPPPWAHAATTHGQASLLPGPGPGSQEGLGWSPGKGEGQHLADSHLKLRSEVFAGLSPGILTVPFEHPSDARHVTSIPSSALPQPQVGRTTIPTFWCRRLAWGHSLVRVQLQRQSQGPAPESCRLASLAPPPPNVLTSPQHALDSHSGCCVQLGFLEAEPEMRIWGWGPRRREKRSPSLLEMRLCPHPV